MRVDHYRDIPPLQAGGTGQATPGLTTRRIMSSAAAEATMDICEINAGASSAFHTHPWEHQVFVVAGQGAVTDGQDPIPFRAGDVVVIPVGQPHQFVNVGDSHVLFVCLLPTAALTSSPHDLTARASGEAEPREQHGASSHGQRDSRAN